jgi:hypothetical protein
MAKRKRDEPARRLLDAWIPPKDAGEPMGCVATTFTFDPVFFEEHCASRFLRLETDPREDGAAYLLEREEKLAQTTVTVLVDRSTADGSASPRWDVLPVAIPVGILHAKISILGWHNWIRVLIGSANLTEPGYRKNQEIFGALDFSAGGNVDFEVLNQILRFVRELADFAPGADVGLGPKSRLMALLASLGVMAARWTAGPRKGEWPVVVPVLLGPMGDFARPIPDRLAKLARDRGGPAHSACVLSPFFDKSSDQRYPGTDALIGSLTERGHRHLEFLVPAEELRDGRMRLRAPRSLARPGRRAAEIAVYPVRDEADGEVRPIHAKAIWLWNDRWHAYMIGSSNFTRAGLGLTDMARNAEANLVYVFPEDSPVVRLLEATLPESGDEIVELDSVFWEAVEEEQGEGAAGGAVLPLGFQEALFDPAEGGHVLSLHFGTELPSRWRVTSRAGDDVVYSHEAWVAAGRPSSIELRWTQRTIPNVLEVRWWDAAGAPHTAPWPVNVRDMGRLPPPDELRNLSLETLVAILGSRLPLHEAVERARSKFHTIGNEREPPTEIDPLRRVRTETFLLQRTRRVARAIERLIDNLNRPVVHRDALFWRLRGPVSPLALAQALAAAAQSPGEACFLPSEVSLALRRVDVPKIAVGVDAKEVRRELDGIKADVDARARQYLATEGTPPGVVTYVAKALEQARR